MKKIRIVAIDSGVKRSHPAFDEDIQGFQIVDGIVTPEFEDEYGHGTAVYGILRKCKNYADILNIKIPGIQDGVDAAQLIKILEFIRDHKLADVINLSLGIEICEDIARLKHVVDDLFLQGVIMVSAFSNSGSFSYPAAFENVIGVRSGAFCRTADDFEYIRDSVVNLGARGAPQRLCWADPEYVVLDGNSFACAAVTARVAQIMNSGILSFENILQEIKSSAVKEYESKEHIINKIPFSIKRAAVFPFNKEMHALFRFSHLLDFKITAVYDSKYSARVGATTSHLLKCDTNVNISIENIEQVEWSKFDTLILGHIDELSNIIDVGQLRSKILNQAIENKKNIFSFDPIPEEYQSFSNNLYYPKVTKENVPARRFGMLYRCSKPVLGIFGTSSKQGKFTLQLGLREKLSKLGYRVGQIGTEPSSELFGMDIVFPMGYNTTVNVEGMDVVVFLNYCINELCADDRDIIIVGSQSGTAIYDVGNLQHYTLMQQSFLMGTMPDAVVLCINPYDDITYITKSIKLIESLTTAKVVALVLFPMTIKDDWSAVYGQRVLLSSDELFNLKSEFSRLVGLPTYVLGNNADLDALVENIINFF